MQVPVDPRVRVDRQARELPGRKVPKVSLAMLVHQARQELAPRVLKV